MKKSSLLLILIYAVLIVVGPLLFIWSLNTLFPVLAIPYTIWTWLAALFISGVFKSANGK